MRNRSGGFTIIEVLVAAGLLGIAVTVGVSAMTYIWGVASANLQNEVSVNVMEQLSEAFGDNDDNCKQMLGGLAFDPTNVAGTQVPSLDQYDQWGAKQKNIVTLGKPVGSGGLVIADIRLKPVSILASPAVAAKLEITTQKASGTPGPQATVLRVPVLVVVQGGTVASCSVSGANNTSLNNRICDVQSDGYSQWDPVAQTCVDRPGVTWVPGPDTSKATCPAGSRLAGAVDDPNIMEIACRVNNSGLVNTPRTYTNNTSTEPAVYASDGSADFVTNTCNFLWPVGQDLSTTKTFVRCVPADFNL